MFEGLKRLQPGASACEAVLYAICRAMCRGVLRWCFRARAEHAERVPVEGALLLVANHQSYLDPPLVGSFVARHCSYLARAGLFRFRPFGWLIGALGSVPVKGDGSDAGAIRQILHELSLGKAVVIFPEGGRSHAGDLHEFKRGVSLLVKKARCPVVPVAIEGATHAWGRGRWPGVGKRVRVRYLPTILPEELLRDGADAALRRLEREIQAARLELRARLREETKGKYPPPGAGDIPEIVRPPSSPASRAPRDPATPGEPASADGTRTGS